MKRLLVAGAAMAVLATAIAVESQTQGRATITLPESGPTISHDLMLHLGEQVGQLPAVQKRLDTHDAEMKAVQERLNSVSGALDVMKWVGSALILGILLPIVHGFIQSA